MAQVAQGEAAGAVRARAGKGAQQREAVELGEDATLGFGLVGEGPEPAILGQAGEAIEEIVRDAGVELCLHQGGHGGLAADGGGAEGGGLDVVDEGGGFGAGAAS
ncbi:MAG: hypothetical protein R3B72_51345 [Polyangiaceae bacterium]